MALLRQSRTDSGPGFQVKVLQRFEVVPWFEVVPGVARERGDLISQKVFSKSVCRGQLPHRPVNLSFVITNIKNKLTDLCGS